MHASIRADAPPRVQRQPPACAPPTARHCAPRPPTRWQQVHPTASARSKVASPRSEEHTSELSHVAISYAVFCLKKKYIKYIEYYYFLNLFKNIFTSLKH